MNLVVLTGRLIETELKFGQSGKAYLDFHCSR